MKHLLVIIIVLLAQTAFAQRFELQTYKPSKDIQNEVHEWDDRNICGGYSIGSLWKDSGLTKPYLSLIREADRYLLRVDLSSAGGVYVTGIDQHPFANFEDAEGNVMSLLFQIEFPRLPRSVRKIKIYGIPEQNSSGENFIGQKVYDVAAFKPTKGIRFIDYPELYLSPLTEYDNSYPVFKTPKLKEKQKK